MKTEDYIAPCAASLLQRAHAGAQLLGHDCVYSEDLGLALGEDVDLMRNLFDWHSADLQAYRQKIETQMDPPRASVARDLPPPPRVKKILARAQKEAGADQSITVEHVILGVALEGESLVAQSLAESIGVSLGDAKLVSAIRVPLRVLVTVDELMSAGRYADARSLCGAYRSIPLVSHGNGPDFEALARRHLWRARQ